MEDGSVVVVVVVMVVVVFDLVVVTGDGVDAFALVFKYTSSTSSLTPCNVS
jgi:hypothetical protein